jgi:hypothetical protein
MYAVSTVELGDCGTRKKFVGVALHPKTRQQEDSAGAVLILVTDLLSQCFPSWTYLELQRALQALNAPVYKLNK